MGRRKIIEDDGVLERILASYAKHDNVEKVAKEVKISEKTIRKYLKEEGVLKPRGRRPGKTYASAKRSTVHEWLKANAGRKLPANPTDIAKMMNVSPDAVKSYFYRRKKKYERIVANASPLNTTAFLLEVDSKKIPFVALGDYEVEEILPNGIVRISGTLRSGMRIRTSFRISQLIRYLVKNHPEIAERL